MTSMATKVSCSLVLRTAQGAMVTAKAVLGDRFSEMRERIVDVWRRRNEATDGRLRLPQEYLLSIVRL